MKVKKNINVDDLSILILSFDGYKDVWEYFFAAFKKYWKNCKYPVYLANNEIKINYKNVNIINTGKEINWCERTKRALREIESKYVLLLLEDYLIGDYVDSINIEKSIKFMKDNDAKYFRITNIPKSNCKYRKEGNTYNISKNEEYGINLQASIWETQHLLSILNSVNGSPWEFEIFFLKDAVNASDEPFNDYYVNTENIIDIHNGILKGKWFPDVIRYFNKRGISIDYHNRGKLSNLEYIKYMTKVKIKDCIPYKLRKSLKKICIKIGVKFVSKY